jgi:hypothetical protein
VYLAIDAPDAVRLVSGDGKERVLPTGLVDISSATWSEDSRHLLVVGHPDPSADLDCWIVPVDGGTPVDTGVLRQARQRDLVVISMAVAWDGRSIFFTRPDGKASTCGGNGSRRRRSCPMAGRSS